MGFFDSIGANNIALIFTLAAILTSKSIKNPAKAAVIGGWISVFGDMVGAVADTQEFVEEREEEKKKILKEIDELKKRLEQL